MIEISKGKFIENTGAILRYLVREFEGCDLYDLSKDEGFVVDQNLDYILNQILLPLSVVLTVERKMIELDIARLNQIKKDLFNNLNTYSKMNSDNQDLGLNLSDFVLFGVLNASIDKDIRKKLKNMEFLSKRWESLQRNSEFKRLFGSMVNSVLN